MMAHWLILSSAVSLGGMASLGVMHYLSVDEQVVEKAALVENVDRQSITLQEQQLVLKKEAAQMEQRLREEFSKENEKLATLVEELIVHLEGVQEAQGAQSQQLKLMSRELTSMEFKMETLDRSFIPLPQSGGDPLRSLETSQLQSLLLPPKSR